MYKYSEVEPMKYAYTNGVLRGVRGQIAEKRVRETEEAAE